MASGTYHLTDNDVLYYLHIPKTAGTSFTDVLKANFKPEESSFLKLIGDFVLTPPETLAKYKAISGHYFYNIEDVIRRTPIFITMLREPIDRTISYYAYIHRVPTHYAHDIVKNQSLL